MFEHWSTISATFLASFVELVEALTIVLAVGAVRGWRWALSGAAAAIVCLSVLIILCGPQLQRLNVAWFKGVVGFLLLLMGLRWLRKAVLRAAGARKQRNEADAYEREAQHLREDLPTATGVDAGAFLTAFNGVFVEGVEVIFIVLAVGVGTAKMAPAVLGALAAAVAVTILGIVARRPLTRIPENALKYAVGVLVCAFGTFWVGEGIGIRWPWGDYSLIALSLSWLTVSAAGVAMVHPRLPGANELAAEGRSARIVSNGEAPRK